VLSKLEHINSMNLHLVKKKSQEVSLDLHICGYFKTERGD